MSEPLLRLVERKRLPVMRQTEAAECGLACLGMIAAYHGHRVDLNTLRRRHPVSLKGVTMRALMQIAAQMQFTCRAVRFDINALRNLQLPAILHWEMNHFVVLKEVRRRELVIHDPALGARRISLQRAAGSITGVALELSPAVGFVRKDERARLPLRAFWSETAGMGHGLVQIVALSAVLELLVVASPFYMQLTVDEIIGRGDADLLSVLALGFGALMLIKVAATALRSQIVLVIQNTLQFQMGARLFHHLVRLPLAYFERRHIGDVLSRFSSLEPIRNLLAEGAITSLIDGFMAVATLMMMLIYAPVLAAVVFGALVLYTLLRLASFHIFRARSESVIQAHAVGDTSFIETARAMQSTKLFGRESEREAHWLSRHADFVNASVSLGRARIAFKTFSDLIFGAENILTIYLAARLALDNAISVGMIFAFFSYRQNFVEKGASLVEKAIEFRLLDLHLERLTDIALTPKEPGLEGTLDYSRQIVGRIELRDVAFRYAETEPFVLSDVNLIIQPGRFVTIMGPSGGGKTTLIKLMLGLLEPTCGEVLVDGIPLPVIGPNVYRHQVAAVMQDDQLLSGSIADNISFFDPEFDPEWMMRCAEVAGIHDEIMAMPMSYNSLIGDMGSSLSGGQKQRVLLARALYRRPKILFLDEGTAHLDRDNERAIGERLRRLDITRVSVAHRPDLAAISDEVIVLGRNGAAATGPAPRGPEEPGNTGAQTPAHVG